VLSEKVHMLVFYPLLIRARVKTGISTTNSLFSEYLLFLRNYRIRSVPLWSC